MSKPPKIFFSYSPTKSTNQNLIKRVIQEAKLAVSKRNWGVIDPMVDINLQSIRDKVENSLRESDACIIECTTSVPNVMFEAGFGRSLLYPIVFLVSPENRDTPGLQEYFDFIGLDTHRALPADLGDIGYIIYPRSLEDADAWLKFENDLERVMTSLDNYLAFPARHLRWTTKNLMHETLRLAERHPASHPILRLLSGWQEQLIGELSNGGESSFEIDAAYYRRCIAALDNHGDTEILAIADLSDETEVFWTLQADPLRATERIFIVNWRVFFDVTRLSRFGNLLRKQSRHYKVMFTDIETFQQGNRLFGPTTQGHHLLLIEPDLIGGYIDRGGRKYLRLEKNEARYREAKEFYELTRNSAITATPLWSDSQIRSAWMSHREVGRWDPAWEIIANRGINYTSKYDLHIRAWIPDYHRLTGYCVSIAQLEIVRQIRGTKRRLRIMEFGFGTGAITIPLIQWIENLNKPFLELQGEPIVDLYVGVDESTLMRENLNSKIKDRKFDTRYLLLEGTALDGLPEAAINNAPFDLICGSLVLHDIVRDTPNLTLENVMSQASKLLSSHGCLVFADTFTDENEVRRNEQVNYWRKKLLAIGLGEEEVSVFLKHNQEMINTVTMTQISSLAPQYGFLRPELKAVPATPDLSPFKILVLRKSGSEEG